MKHSNGWWNASKCIRVILKTEIFSESFIVFLRELILLFGATAGTTIAKGCLGRENQSESIIYLCTLHISQTECSLWFFHVLPAFAALCWVLFCFIIIKNIIYFGNIWYTTDNIEGEIIKRDNFIKIFEELKTQESFEEFNNSFMFCLLQQIHIMKNGFPIQIRDCLTLSFLLNKKEKHTWSLPSAKGFLICISIIQSHIIKLAP